MTVGGWIAEPAVGKMPQRLATGFTEVLEHYVGASFVPVIYCGRQIVNGTNYMIICTSTKVTNPPSEGVVKVILNEGTDGEFTIVSIDELI